MADGYLWGDVYLYGISIFACPPKGAENSTPLRSHSIFSNECAVLFD